MVSKEMIHKGCNHRYVRISRFAIEYSRASKLVCTTVFASKQDCDEGWDDVEDTILKYQEGEEK